MKRFFVIILALQIGASLHAQNKHLKNPASAYTRFMGYSTKLRVDSLGNQSKVCIMPDSSECDEWAFFRGLCGKEFSYCTAKGCLTENHTDSLASYALCVCKDSSGKETEIPLLEFMEMNGDTLIKQPNIKKRREVKN